MGINYRSSAKKPLLILLLLLFLNLTGCISSRLDSDYVTADEKISNLVNVKPIPGSQTFELTLNQPLTANGSFYGVNLKECGKKISHRTKSKARQLFVDFEDFKINRYFNFSTPDERKIVGQLAQTNMNGKELVMISYTWDSDRCIYDFLVWQAKSPEFEEHKEEILSILNQHVLSMVADHEPG